MEEKLGVWGGHRMGKVVFGGKEPHPLGPKRTEKIQGMQNFTQQRTLGQKREETVPYSGDMRRGEDKKFMDARSIRKKRFRGGSRRPVK